MRGERGKSKIQVQVTSPLMRGERETESPKYKYNLFHSYFTVQVYKLLQLQVTSHNQTLRIRYRTFDLDFVYNFYIPGEFGYDSKPLILCYSQLNTLNHDYNIIIYSIVCV